MGERPAATTFLFTDIEGSTRLWEQDPERMRHALAGHDALTRAAIEGHRGRLVKMVGDGAHAVFDDPLDALLATLELQRSLADPGATAGIALRVRCGLHVGFEERRDNEFFGRAVNRAARLMGVAHGGQVLLSDAVAALVRDRLPPEVGMRDLGSVALRDLAAPERVHQLIHPALRQDFPALRSAAPVLHNLPQSLTSFVGREREVEELKSLLARSRLVTLTGAGGLGKTRLAVRAAAGAVGNYPDGVWFVDLAPSTDERLVPQALASVLGVKEEAGRAVTDALVKYVRERTLLIVLDNCEHLLAGCASLARQLLQSSPNLAILATSREMLRVSGEAVFALPALSIPEPGAVSGAAALGRYDAVRLFVDRALAVCPQFSLSERNAGAVVDICRRLDGIPLAIELAAARMSALSIDQIAARLGDRFRLLTRGDPTALPRQQTLRALIDWSYDLLGEPERALFRRLAVFAGGWTLDAAEAIGGAEEPDSPRGEARPDASHLAQRADSLPVVELLTQLVEKSLVAADAERERYRLLHTVRQYAYERLEASADANDAHRRHFDYFLALAERGRPHLTGPEQGEWLSRFDAERDNLLVAHAWAAQFPGGAEPGLRLVYALKPYWFHRGLLDLGHRLTVEALGRLGAERGFTRCRGLFDAGQLCYFMGRYREAREYLQESLTIARELADRRRIAVALQPLGMACLGQGDASTAAQHLGEALALARELGNPREIAAATNALAQLHRVRGELDLAEPLYQQVLAIARELGDLDSVAIGLLNLAMVAIGRGGSEPANAMLVEVLAIVRRAGSRQAGQSMLEVCAGLAVLRADWLQAARFFGMAEAQSAASGLHRDPADEAFLVPLVARARQAASDEGFATAEAAGRAVAYDEAMAEAGAWLGLSRS